MIAALALVRVLVVACITRFRPASSVTEDVQIGQDKHGGVAASDLQLPRGSCVSFQRHVELDASSSSPTATM